MDSSFQLDPEEHKRVYSEIIEPTSFLDTESVDRPRLVIIAAQPGAGKSKVVEQSARDFGNRNVVVVNTDDLRAYHPKFDEIVSIRVVAVHERFSVWGVYHRYEVEKSSRGHGRYVPINYHNDCYEKLIESIKAVESQNGVDRVEVYSRDGFRLYSSNHNSGSAVRVIENERNRSLTKPEIRQYRDSWSRVFEYMNKRSASKDEIGPVKTIASDFISKLQS